MTDAPAPAAVSPVLDDLRKTAQTALGQAVRDLSDARVKRDALNRSIAALVVTVADLRRVVNAMTRTPRKPAPVKPAGRAVKAVS